MTAATVPSTRAMIWTLAGVTLKRLGRGIDRKSVV